MTEETLNEVAGVIAKAIYEAGLDPVSKAELILNIGYFLDYRYYQTNIVELQKIKERIDVKNNGHRL